MGEQSRAEAIVRNIGSFGRFLECVSLELGYPINMEKICVTFKAHQPKKIAQLSSF